MSYRMETDMRFSAHFRIALLVILICTHVIISAAEDTIIDLDVREADLRESLMHIANKASINVIVSPKVQGKLTCRIKGMEAREMIFFIAKANGLEVEDHSRILVIRTDSAGGKNLRIEVIPLQFADAAEVEKLIKSLQMDKKVRITHDKRTNRLIAVYDE